MKKISKSLILAMLIYSCSSGNDNSKSNNDEVETTKVFEKIEIGHIIAANEKYLCTEADRFVIANRDTSYEWETFKFIWGENNQLSMLSYDDYFLSADFSMAGELVATRKENNEWEKYNVEFLGGDNVAIKASNGKYLSLNQTDFKIFANADKIGENEKFKLIKKN